MEEQEVYFSLLADPRIEPLYWLAGIVVAVLALLVFKQRVKQARAGYLLALNDRWEALTNCRRATYKYYLPLVRAAHKVSGGLMDERWEEEIRKLCKNQLRDARKKRLKGYASCILYLDFFEIIGLAVRRGYIPLRDVVAMYKGPILDADRMFVGHIAEMQEARDVYEGLFENLLYLISETKLHHQKAEARKQKAKARKQSWERFRGRFRQPRA